MSTGILNLDLLLNSIIEDYFGNTNSSVNEIRKRYPSLSEKEANDILLLVKGALKENMEDSVSLVATTPPSFAIKAKSTKNTVKNLLMNADESILITGYSLSEYFSELLDCVIQKSQKGVFVKFFANKIENQGTFEKLIQYKGKFLKIYNYPESGDKMAALHAKVISVDKKKTLITSANLSYHGQEGNIELGTLVESEAYAQQVNDLFTKLIFMKEFVEV